MSGLAKPGKDRRRRRPRRRQSRPAGGPGAALGLAAVLALLALGVVLPTNVPAQQAAAQEEAEPAAAPPATANPHGDLSLPCQECHTAEAWSPLRQPLPFDHGKATGFPLVAAHREVACLGCHEDLRFRRVASACADCHQDPHQRTLGFACAECHSPRGWEDRRPLVSFHATTLFPLTGAHAAADCAACHRGSPPRTYSGAPVDCFSCHAEDFRRTRVPNHAALGFPTECAACHDTASFEGADFRQHDDQFFPILSGPHAGVWSSCSDCHTNPTTFAVFSCLGCHEHRRSEMDDEHDDVGGYRYESSACYACHPRGRE